MTALTEAHATDLLKSLAIARTHLANVESRLREALLSFLPPVGATRSDETGWHSIRAIEWDAYGRPEFIVSDRDGNESTMNAHQLGGGWTP